MITTNRTNIRPLEKGDFDALIDMYLEPDSNKFVAPLKDKPIDLFDSFLNKKIEQNNSEMGFWVAFEKGSNKLLGTVNLNFFNPLSIYHVGCHLKKECWNKGFATELLEAAINYGTRERKLNAIHGIVEKENLTSKKLMKKLGFNFNRIEILEGSQLVVYKLTQHRIKPKQH
jgi:RimJ/RimL family protein N-acetyltransferase